MPLQLGALAAGQFYVGASPVSAVYLGSTLVYTAAGAFSPLQLFASGEQGVWYDPSDLTTMFQDAAGTTPVTAVEQPVGLILDKSKGLTLGPELASGWLDSTSGWANISGSTISGGTLSIAVDSAPYRGHGASRTALFEITFTVSNVTGGGFRIALNNSGTETAGITTNGAKTIRLKDSGIGGGGYVMFASNAGGTAQISGLSIRELPGNHATQPTATARPVLKIDGNGKHYLLFDGVDDFLVTNTITPSTDKVQVFAGVRKLSNAAAALYEFSANALQNNGAMAIYTDAAISGTYEIGARQSTQYYARTSPSFNSPTTNVLAQIIDFSVVAASLAATLRVNSSLQSLAQVSGGNMGQGNFGNYPLYIGRRGGASLPFNGHLYSLIMRFGPNLTTDQITQTENWVNGKTGAY